MKHKSFNYLKALISPKLPSTYRNVSGGITESLKFNKTVTRETTIDQSHVDKHAKLVTEWWNPSGPMIALHSFNLIRVPLIRDGLVFCEPNERTVTPLSTKNILDVGCGGGILSEAIARLGANVTGIDASSELIDLATTHANENLRLVSNRPSYKCTTIEEHSQHFTDYYDAVVASEVIEHVSNKELFIKSCIRAVKPGGKIFITTPTRSRLMQIFGICVAEYVLNIVPRNTHEYEKLTTPNEVTFLLERNNCHVQLIHGLLYNPVSNKWSWIASSQLMFALQAEKLENS